ncbi:hypothetical protein SDC9_193087 [bioreactor metagenome]|uniref:Uncharacterized protein n=1 Tax=bioreactor metagenome TaxID=1076179 RepID=A0A645I2Y6_9ZZZZ
MLGDRPLVAGGAGHVDQPTDQLGQPPGGDEVGGGPDPLPQRPVEAAQVGVTVGRDGGIAEDRDARRGHARSPSPGRCWARKPETIV